MYFLSNDRFWLLEGCSKLQIAGVEYNRASTNNRDLRVRHSPAPTEIILTHCGICKGLDTYVSILGRPTISMAHMV